MCTQQGIPAGARAVLAPSQALCCLCGSLAHACPLIISVVYLQMSNKREVIDLTLDFPLVQPTLEAINKLRASRGLAPLPADHQVRWRNKPLPQKSKKK
jgi:hypothetical protein